MADASTAVLTIELAAIAENYTRLAERARPARCGAAVKADAYGLGVAMVAPVLANAGCKHFFVATLDEGLALRRILPNAQIYILNGLPAGAADKVAAAKLIPVLATVEQVAAWGQYCRSAGPEPAALIIDTGMSRLGLSEADMARLAAEPALTQGIPFVHAMSHLACADDAAHPLNLQQRTRFKALVERFPWQGKRPSLGISASSGIFLGPDYQFDLVRPGAALYGLEPTIGRPNPMRPVVALEGKILQIRDVDLGMTVGYGATHQFRGRSRLAVIGMGYADGIFRSLGNRGAVFVAGERASIVGRISMDLMTADIGHLSSSAQVGDAVEIIGPHQSVDDLARDAGTIGYEILTALGSRYRRRYLPAGA
jgi:alanine racemase